MADRIQSNQILDFTDIRDALANSGFLLERLQNRWGGNNSLVVLLRQAARPVWSNGSKDRSKIGEMRWMARGN